MSNFRIDIKDQNTGNKALNFPVRSVRSVTRRKRLDAATRYEFGLPVADPIYAELINQAYDFDIFWQWNNATYNIGLASYLTHQVQANGKIASINAAGGVYDLGRQTVLQRSFDGASDDVNDVLDTIVALRSGWSLGDVDTITTAAPLDFWYETILDGVELLAKTFDYHFREGSSNRTLDFGAFGESSGLTAIGGDGLNLSPEMYANPDIIQIQELGIAYQSDKVVNQLIPFGGAVGVATIDLGETTSTQPGYPVQTDTLPDGSSYYFIKDATSITQYGLTERRFVRSDLRPIVNSDVAREYAANILYEAALATLLNLKDRQIIYDLSVTGLIPGSLDVGDKLAVRYLGVAETPAGEMVWLDLDQEFYVLEMDESFETGITARLKINENAVHEQTVNDLLANTIKEFERSTIHVQPTVGPDTYGPYVKRIDTTYDAEFSFNLGDETLDLYYAKLRLTGEPLKSSIKAVAGASTTTPSGGGSTTPSGGGSTTPSGGGATSGSTAHDHPLNVQGYPSGVGVPVYWHISYGLNCTTGGSETHSISDDTPAHSHSTPNHTHTTPNHTHTTPNHQHTFTPNVSTTYGIYQDATRPNSLTIKVNGSTVASGVTLSAGNDYTYELDITSSILAAADLRQEHTVTIEAGSGQGEIQLQIQALKVIQPVRIN